MEKSRNIQAIKKALDTRKMLSVKFSKEGTSVEFHFLFNNGRGVEDQAVWLPIKEALPLLSGYTFEQIL